MSAFSVGGVTVPDAGPVFLAVLAVHVVAGLVCVVAGAVAAVAGKPSGRHVRAGGVYQRGLAVLAGTAAVLAVIRWREDAYLFAIAVLAYGLGLFGRLAARGRRAGWVRRHAVGVGGSYIALLTGFYVDNGPHLPLWHLLPYWVFWCGPAAVGVPLIWWGVRRHSVSVRPPAGAARGG